MKNILLQSLVFLSLFSIAPLYADYQTDLNVAKSELLKINKGVAYASAIDALIAKYERNEDILIQLSDRIEFLETQKLSSEVFTLLEYLDIQLEYNLDIILQEKEDKRIQEELKAKEEADKLKKEQEAKEELSNYPGFSSTYNDEAKNILGWEYAEIHNGGISASLESSEVEKVIVYISWNDLTWFKNTIKSASFLLEGKELKKVSASKVDELSSTQAKITFDNIDDFIVTQNHKEFRIGITTNASGKQNTWEIIRDFYVSKVGFDDITGLSSGQKIPVFTQNETGENNSIVPAVLKLRLDRNLSSNLAEINIVADFGENTNTNSFTSPQVELNTLKLSTLWSSGIGDLTFTLANKDNTSNKIIGTLTDWIITFDLRGLTQSNRTLTNSSRGEDYDLYISGWTGNVVLNLNVLKDGIIYDVPGRGDDFESRYESEFKLGSKTY